MKRYLLAVLLAVAGSTPVLAEFPSPELQEIYPAGGQAGTGVEVVISGLNLEGIEELRFSNPEITAERVYHPKTRHWTEPRPQGNTFRVTIPKDVAPGSYDVRVVGYYGPSSPRIFQVSAPSEPAELDSDSVTNNTIETAQSLNLESVANGRIKKNYGDYYKVALKKGQRILVHCWAIRLGSKLDAQLALFDADGVMIFKNNDYVGRDPMLDFTATKDGEYFVSVSDQTWQGTTGYVYRVSVSEKPYIETVYPAVARPGGTSRHTVYGRNLPGGKETGEFAIGGKIEALQVSIQAPPEPEKLPLDGRRPLLGFYDGFQYRIGGSNAFRLALSDARSLVEKEQDEAIPVTLPVEICGRFDEEEDVDEYRFSAKKGDRLWIEVFADRQFVRSDPFVVIEHITVDGDGNETAKEAFSLDDFRKVKTQGMYDIHSFDDGIEVDIDADGDYRLVVGDNFSKQGALHHYRIRVAPSKPDFRLLTFVEQFHFYGDRRTTVYPGALQLRPEGILPVRVRASRKGGREHPIQLRVEGLPKGVKAHPANIFPGEEEAYIVLEADKTMESWTGNIRIFGSIGEGDEKVEREATGATLNWSGSEITYGYSQRLNARRTRNIPLALLGEELPVPITLSQKEVDKVWDFKKNETVKIPLVSKRTDDMKGAVTVMEFGANHKLTFPFRIFVNGDKETELGVSYKPNSTTNLDLPGEGAFILRGWADINYATYRKGAEQIAALKTKVDGVAQKLTLARSGAEADLEKAKGTLAKKVLAEGASAPAAEAEKLKQAVKKAEENLKTAQADLVEIEGVQKEIHAEAARVEKLATETRFRAGFFSLPVRFRVLPAE